MQLIAEVSLVNNRLGSIDLHTVIIFCVIAISLVFYMFSPNALDYGLLNISLVFAACLLVMFYFLTKKIGLSKNPFSLSFLFVLAYYIVFFQMPTDLALGSFEWSYIQNFFYDFGLINKQVFFAVLFFGFFLLGFSFAINKFLKSVPAHSNHVVHEPVSTKLFFLLFYTFTLLHLITIDPSYYTGTIKGDPQGLAGSILGYFIRLMPICFGVVVYNAKVNDLKVSTPFAFIKLFPKIFLIVILLFSFGTFIAGDRGPAIRALILLVFSFYILSEKKVSFLKFGVAIFIAGYFLSIIKLTGGIDYQNTSIVDSFLSAADRYSQSDKTASIVPFTTELAGSFRSYSIGFSLWYEGFSLYGIAALTGTLMAIPYAVSVLMQLLNLSKTDINASNLVTVHVGESYGLGNSIVSDALLNVGFLGTLIIAYIFGKVVARIDIAFYKRNNNIYVYCFGFYILMNALSLARGSIFPMIGNVLGIAIVVFLVKQLNKMVKSI